MQTDTEISRLSITNVSVQGSNLLLKDWYPYSVIWGQCVFYHQHWQFKVTLRPPAPSLLLLLPPVIVICKLRLYKCKRPLQICHWWWLTANAVICGAFSDLRAAVCDVCGRTVRYCGNTTNLVIMTAQNMRRLCSGGLKKRREKVLLKGETDLNHWVLWHWRTFCRYRESECSYWWQLSVTVRGKVMDVCLGLSLCFGDQTFGVPHLLKL